MDTQAIMGTLKDLHYPITKQELLQIMEQKGLAEGKQLLAEHLPEQAFSNAEEVMQKLPLSSFSGKFMM